MSWEEPFDSAPSNMTAVIAGNGTVTYSGGEAILNTPAISDAAILRVDDVIDETTDSTYTCKIESDGAITSAVQLMALHDGTPVPDTAANVNPNLKFIVTHISPTNSIQVVYKDSGGTFQYWNGIAWGAVPANAHSGDQIAHYHWVSLLVRNGKFRLSMAVFGKTQTIIDTPWVDFADLESFTTLKIYAGDIYTNAYAAASTKIDFFKFDDEDILFGFFNARDALPDENEIFRGMSTDGGENLFLDPLTPVIVGLAGESHVKDAYTLKIGSTVHMLYTALRDANPYNTKRRIRYTTSADDGETWADHGYITTPGGGGDWDELGHLFPVFTFDSGTSTFHVYIAGISAGNVFTIGYWSGAALGSLSEHGSNPVISEGAGGSWNELGNLPHDISVSGNTITLWCSGLDSPDTWWRCGKYTSINWIAWTPDGSNPLFGRDPSKSFVNADNITALDESIGFDSPHGFVIGEALSLGKSVGGENNRVLTVPGANTVGLAYPTGANYLSPDVMSYEGGSVVWGSVFPDDNWAYIVPFELVYGEETTGWLDFDGTWSINNDKTPPLPLLLNKTSTENPRLIRGTVDRGGIQPYMKNYLQRRSN